MIDAGLCRTCGYARWLRSHRGALFLLCGRSREERRYARYPRLPVFRCPGYTEVNAREAAPPASEEVG
jgi:hypothetical protein